MTTLYQYYAWDPNNEDRPEEPNLSYGIEDAEAVAEKYAEEYYEGESFQKAEIHVQEAFGQEKLRIFDIWVDYDPMFTATERKSQ